MAQAITDVREAQDILRDLFDRYGAGGSGRGRAVFFGGAGVSTASGIPDFRSVDGLYHQRFAYPPEVMLGHDFYMTHTPEFYECYRA